MGRGAAPVATEREKNTALVNVGKISDDRVMLLKDMLDLHDNMESFCNNSAKNSEISQEKLDNLWTKYIDFITKARIEDKENITNAAGKKEIQQIYKSSLEELDSLEKSEPVKNLKQDKTKYGKIVIANKRINDLIDDTKGSIAAAKGFEDDYDERVKKYKETGEGYPDVAIFREIEANVKTINSNIKLLDSKTTKASSKSFVASDDVKKKYKDNKDEYVKKAEHFAKLREEKKDTIAEMELYKKGNQEILTRGSVFSESMHSAKLAEKKFKDNRLKVGDKEVLTKSNKHQYLVRKQAISQAESQKSVVDEINKKMAAGEIKVSDSIREKWDSNISKLNSMLDDKTMHNDYITMRKNRNEILKSQEKKEKGKGEKAKEDNNDIKILVDSLSDSLHAKLENYNNRRRKIRLEAEAEKGEGTVSEIIKLGKDFKSMKHLLKNPTDADKAKYAEREKEYEEFKILHKQKKASYESIKKYIGDSTDRKMIMRLIRRVKLIESSGGATPDSEYTGNASKMSAFLEKVESLPEKGAKKTLKAAGMTSERKQDVTIQAATEVTNETLEDTSSTLDFIEDMADAKKKKAKAKDTEEKKGILDVDTSSAEGRYSLAMNILGVAKSGYSMFKQVLSAMKDFKGGVDKREATKEILDLAEGALDMFDSISSFFNLDIPVLGTIKSSISIILKIIDFVRSSTSRYDVSKRKKEMREKMKTDGYGLDNDTIKENAKKSGYDTRGTGVVTSKVKHLMGKGPSTAARIHEIRKSEEDKYLQKKGMTDEVAKGGEEAKRDSVTGSMHSRMHELRASVGGNVSDLKGDAKEEYERLEKIASTHEYDILTEASVRMRNKSRDDIKGIISEGWSIVSGFLKMTPAAVGAVATDIAMKIGDVLYTGTSKVNTLVRDVTGNMYSTKGKEFRRSKMAANMYDRMVVASEILNSKGDFDIENHADWELEEAEQHIETLHFDLVNGLDAYISHIIDCNSRDEVIEQISKAFSVEGN